MAESKSITLNDFARFGYSGREALEMFEIYRAYEPLLEERGRSDFREIRTAISKHYGLKEFNWLLSKLTGEDYSIENIFGAHLSTRALNRIPEEDRGRAVHLEKFRKKSYLEDGNSEGKGFYAPARKAAEERGSYLP